MRKMTVSNARLRFKIQTYMTPTVRMNFRNDAKYKLHGWLCPNCKNIDTQEHVLHCYAYSHLREHKTLENDNDLVSYVSQVISHRLKHESE